VTTPRAVANGKRVDLAAMALPDLAPWFDNASDDYHELPCGDHETPYDE
jgi:hypothetical protein